MAGISITQLAEQCGVAVSTVSRAMNNRSGISPHTRERILKAAQDTGYIPNAAAKNLKIASTQTVAVIMQGRTSELSSGILEDIRDHLDGAGLAVFPVHVTDQDATASTIISLSSERRFTGLIFLGRYGDRTGTEDPTLGQFLASKDLPVVFCTTKDLSTTPMPHPSVSVDDFDGAYRLTSHLLELGHRRIAFGAVEAGSPLESDHAWALRYRGYKAALANQNIPIGPNWLIPATNPRDMYSMDNGYRSVKRWVQANHFSGTDRPTAIIGSCDTAGLGAIRALHELGLSVPGDVSVTGFDGLDFTKFTIPTLTTVIQPTVQIARQTAEILIHAVEGKAQATESRWIPGQICLGESAGPPPNE